MNQTKQHGTTWVYPPIPCVTGALHAQPQGNAVEIAACTDFTPDFYVMVDSRGALDAPLTIPSGSVRARDFIPDPTVGRILVSHVYRDGWFS